jgi:hypothetical protein
VAHEERIVGDLVTGRQDRDRPHRCDGGDAKQRVQDRGRRPSVRWLHDQRARREGVLRRGPAPLLRTGQDEEGPLPSDEELGTSARPIERCFVADRLRGLPGACVARAELGEGTRRRAVTASEDDAPKVTAVSRRVHHGPPFGTGG